MEYLEKLVNAGYTVKIEKRGSGFMVSIWAERFNMTASTLEEAAQAVYEQVAEDVKAKNEALFV